MHYDGYKWVVGVGSEVGVGWGKVWSFLLGGGGEVCNTTWVGVCEVGWGGVGILGGDVCNTTWVGVGEVRWGGVG